MIKLCCQYHWYDNLIFCHMYSWVFLMHFLQLSFLELWTQSQNYIQASGDYGIMPKFLPYTSETECHVFVYWFTGWNRLTWTAAVFFCFFFNNLVHILMLYSLLSAHTQTHIYFSIYTSKFNISVQGILHGGMSSKFSQLYHCKNHKMLFLTKQSIPLNAKGCPSVLFKLRSIMNMPSFMNFSWGVLFHGYTSCYYLFFPLANKNWTFSLKSVNYCLSFFNT